MKREADLWQEAIQYQENQEDEKAKQALLKLLIINPQHTDTLRWLGVMAAKQLDFQKASHYFEQGILYAPDDPQLHHELGLSFVNQDQFDNAKRSYEKAIALKPDFAEALNNLASLYYKQGNFHQAKQLYEKAIYYQPDYLAALYNLALIDMQELKFDHAIEQFQRVLSISPEHGHTHFHLANLLVQQGQYTEAIKHYEKAIRQQPALVTAYANLAAVHLKQHAVTDAKKYYELALALDPNSIDVHFNMGVIFASQGNQIKAIEHYKKALELDPSHSPSLQNLGACYYKQDQFSLAIASYEKALEITPQDPNLRYLLSALKQDQKPETAPNTYIKTLFDDYAFDYDHHIQTLLFYQVPTQLTTLIETIKNPDPYSFTVLDLGCGTGLMGEKIKPYSSYLLGVDLSKPMLEKANEKMIYHELICSDIKPFVSHCDRQFDLILAADVLGYIGKLDILFSQITKLLVPQGVFAFSIELTEQHDFKLQPTGRFQHRIEYIHQLAHQYHFTIIAEKKETIRLQKGFPVHGVLFLLEIVTRNSIKK